MIPPGGPPPREPIGIMITRGPRFFLRPPSLVVGENFRILEIQSFKHLICTVASRMAWWNPMTFRRFDEEIRRIWSDPTRNRMTWSFSHPLFQQQILQTLRSIGILTVPRPPIPVLAPTFVTVRLLIAGTLLPVLLLMGYDPAIHATDMKMVS